MHDSSGDHDDSRRGSTGSISTESISIGEPVNTDSNGDGKRSPGASRRRFLMVIGGAMAASAGGVWYANRSGHMSQPGLTSVSPGPGPLQETSRSSNALGADVSITVLHQDLAVASASLDAAFDELERVESLMSVYRDDSQLSELNRDGVLRHPHPCLVEVLEYALRQSRLTGGAFDVTVQPLWCLYYEASLVGALPTPSEVESVRRLIDWRKIRIERDRIELAGDRTAITLNGIAQGYAADRVVAALRKSGIQHAMVDTGEISSLGTKAGGDRWTIGIQHPRQEDAYLCLAKLDGRCVATSGDYATRFGTDERWNHLFDPSTGCSPTEIASVSVAASTAMQADALSTSFCVLGLEKSQSLIRRTADADALIVTKDGRCLGTPGFPSES